MNTTTMMFDKLITTFQDEGYYLPCVNLIPDVGTHIRFAAKGGLISGVPFLTVSDVDKCITLWCRKLLCKNMIAGWSCRNEEEGQVAIEQILQHLSQWHRLVIRH